MININGIGKRINTLRVKAKMTQVELANKLKITRRETIYSWEKGKVIPSIWDLKEICDIFQCDITYLLGEHECKTRKATDIQKTTGLSEEAITVLILLQEHKNLKIKAIIEITNMLIESLRDSTEIWNLFQSIIAYMLNEHLNDLWCKKQKIDKDDSFLPLEDLSHHDLTLYKVKRNFDILMEYLLNVPKYKNRAEKIFQANFNYCKYAEEQFELERRIPVDISDGSYKTAISQTLKLFFNDGYEEKPDIKTQLDFSPLAVIDTPLVTECQPQTIE